MDDYKIVACHNCGQKLRIPANKTIIVTCPRCKFIFTEYAEEKKNETKSFIELMEEAEAWAARLAVVPSITLEQNKRAINHAYDLAGLSQAFEFNMHTGAHIEQSADPVARAERNAFILEHGVSAWLKQHNEEMAKKAAEQEK